MHAYIHMTGIEMNHPVLQQYIVDGIECPVDIDVFRDLVEEKVITEGTSRKKHVRDMVSNFYHVVVMIAGVDCILVPERSPRESQK